MTGVWTNSSHSDTLAGDSFLAWLNMAKPDDPGLHHLTDGQIIETFRLESITSCRPNQVTSFKRPRRRTLLLQRKFP